MIYPGFIISHESTLSSQRLLHLCIMALQAVKSCHHAYSMLFWHQLFSDTQQAGTFWNLRCWHIILWTVLREKMVC